MFKNYLLKFVVLALGILLPQLARATIFIVSTTSDTTDVSAGDGSCADSTGACSLRAAIQEANALAGADTVRLSSGTYRLSITGSGEDVSATGDLDITSEVTILGQGSPKPIIVSVGGGRTVAGVLLGNDRVFHILTSGSATLYRLTIKNGYAPSDPGGGIYSKGTLTLVNSTVTNNTGSWGGGISFGYGSSGHQITNSTISNNTAQNFAGIDLSGIYSTNTITISGSTISGNTASGDGGGLGDENCGVTGSYAVIINSTISGNVAGGSGGGIMLCRTTGGFASLNLYNVTLAENTAARGAGFHRGIAPGSLEAYNSIIANNSSDDCYGTINGDYNLIEDTTYCTVTGLAITGYDPSLNALANNGGLTQTQSLQAGSPAIDAGVGCEDNSGTTLTTDQRNSTRPNDGDGDGTAECDIGAYEY